MTEELHYATVAETSRLIHDRKLSPVEYTDALLERIEALEPQLNSVITITADRARSRARQAEAEIMVDPGSVRVSLLPHRRAPVTLSPEPGHRFRSP